ncbi:MAG: hypothetical protein DRI86_01515 [Bacteroidetes bacterium]|nr:MAG: hypothetical protein DRI86_01515 [Bacteroidota bacterium]
MKLLMIYCDRFAYKPAIKTLDNVQEHTEGKEFSNSQVAYIQVEEGDESDDRQKSIEKKLLNFIKWISRKNNTKSVILHSFAHLSESKASPEFTKELFDKIEKRLKNVDFEVEQTPFGYFLDLDVQAPGFSLARVFQEFH